MLHKIQKQFLTGLFSQEISPDIISVINDNGSRSAIDQFMSYRDSVIGGMLEAMTVSYPVVKKLVGELYFNNISAKFIRETPSTSPDLNDYGQNFANFIDNQESATSVPYLSDVARLEWAWQKIINGSDIENNNLHLLGNLTDEQNSRLMFNLTPHSSLLTSIYPIDKIWDINQSESSHSEIQIENSKINLLIWRNNLNMNITPILIEQWTLLSLVSRDLLFTEVCNEFNKIFSELNISDTLTHCIQEGWINSYTIK